MSYKFNRDCWVDSSENALFDFNKLSFSAGNPSLTGSDKSSQNRRPPLTLQQKIELAYDIFERQQRSLLASAPVSRLVRRLQLDLQTSWQSMVDLNIVKMCSECDATAPQGSCCSCGIERKYDVSLLIANLILGVSLPEQHERKESCYFLGSRGCKLRARHMLCVDYLCPVVQNELGCNLVAEIQSATAGEVETTFLLCEEIKKLINR